ncbi:MAG: hypothetical protein ACLTJB_12505, partial [Holdemania filiformis]
RKTPGISQAPPLIHAPLLKRLPCVGCRAFLLCPTQKRSVAAALLFFYPVRFFSESLKFSDLLCP